MNELVKSLRRDDLLLGGYVDPAPLAAKIATVDDGNVEKWRKDLASFESLFMFLDGARSLPAHVPGQFPQGPLVGLEQKAFGKLEVHPRVILSTRGASEHHREKRPPPNKGQATLGESHVCPMPHFYG